MQESAQALTQEPKIIAPSHAALDRQWRVAVIDHYRNQSLGGREGHGTHRSFNGLPGVTICAVADPDPVSRKDLLTDTGAATGYADWRELLIQERPDVICLSTRLPEQHPEIVCAAAAAGCHIYCEKPFAINLNQADRMITAANDAGVLIAVAHVGRYAEVYHGARALIENSAIGQPLMAYCRGKEDARGGGEDMMVLGTHLFDGCRFLFGDPQWVFGHVAHQGRDMHIGDARQPTEAIGAVAGDAITANVAFRNGVHCQFESRQGMLQNNVTRYGMTIVGSEGQLAIRYHAHHRVLRICRSTGPFEDESNFVDINPVQFDEIPGAAPLAIAADDFSEHAYFARGNRRAAWDLLCAICEGRPPLSSAADARSALEIIHGVYRSHLDRRPVDLPLSNRMHPLDAKDS